jgi:hypothetical protein
MLILLNSVGLFAIALIAHLLIWKLGLPRHHIKALLFVFATFLLVWLPLTFLFAIPVSSVLHIALFYGTMSLCYIITYSAIEADSPTLSLMRFVAERRREGRTAAEVSHFLAQRPFVKARLFALQNSGLIREENGRYFVAGKGSLGFRFILTYRKLYGPLPGSG